MQVPPAVVRQLAANLATLCRNLGLLLLPDAPFGDTVQTQVMALVAGKGNGHHDDPERKNAKSYLMSLMAKRTMKYCSNFLFAHNFCLHFCPPSRRDQKRGGLGEASGRNRQPQSCSLIPSHCRFSARSPPPRGPGEATAGAACLPAGADVCVGHADPPSGQRTPRGDGGPGSREEGSRRQGRKGGGGGAESSKGSGEGHARLRPQRSGAEVAPLGDVPGGG